MKKITSGHEWTASLLILATIACLSFAIRICPLSHPETWTRDPDSVGYMRLAKGFQTGCGFAPRWQNGKCGPAELERTPGYPLFLAITPDLRSVVTIQAILGAGVCLLVAFFAWNRWGLAAGVIAESIVAFDLSSIIINNIGTEVLFTSIITLAIILQLVTITRTAVDVWFIAGIIGVGCLLGIAELVRPIGQVLCIIAPLPIVLTTGSLSKKIVLSILALSIPVAVIVGWSYRNYQQRGIWTFSSIGAVDLYYYRAAGVLAHETGQSVDQVQVDLLRSAGRESEASDLWSKTFDEDPAEMKSRGIQIVLSHPLYFAFMTFKAFARSSVMPSNRPDVSSFLGHRADRSEANAFLTPNILSSLRSTFKSSWLVTVRALLSFQLALTIFMWIGVGLALCRIRGRPRPIGSLILIPLCTSLLLLAAAAGPEMYDRFRVPVVPMLALVAAFGWTAGRAQNPLAHISAALRYPAAGPPWPSRTSVR
jgi:hypothetical protein